MTPLGLLAPGEKGVISDIRIGRQGGRNCGKSHLGQVEDMGLRVGKEVEMLTANGGGPLLVKVDESRIVLGRGMAMKIMVNPQNV